MLAALAATAIRLLKSRTTKLSWKRMPAGAGTGVAGVGVDGAFMVVEEVWGDGDGDGDEEGV